MFDEQEKKRIREFLGKADQQGEGEKSGELEQLEQLKKELLAQQTKHNQEWLAAKMEERPRPYSLDMRSNDALEKALQALREHKPDDRSEKDRRYAVTITEMEKVLAYFREWVIRAAPADEPMKHPQELAK